MPDNTRMERWIEGERGRPTSEAQIIDVFSLRLVVDLESDGPGLGGDHALQQPEAWQDRKLDLLLQRMDATQGGGLN